MPDAAVSVVIPTTGRDELGRALSSVVGQDVPTEIIVVADMPPDDALAARVRKAAPLARTIFTGGGKRGPHARNVGIANASNGWIAFLDDDDVWRPEKLRIQLHAAATSGASVLSCRVDQFAGIDGASVAHSVPRHVMTPDQDPAHYLFRARRAGAGRASIFTSTLMVEASLAREVAWDETLSRHQDWDWILRLSRSARFKFLHCTETLASIQMGSASSISASPDWESSLEWAKGQLIQDRRTYVDFLTAQTLRYAVQGRSGKGARETLRAIGQARAMPSLTTLLIALSGLLGRRGIERAMSIVK